MRMISFVPSSRWEMASERISSSVTTPPALRITCASPSSSPSTRVGMSRASMQATMAMPLAGGSGSSPLSKRSAYCSALRRSSSVTVMPSTLHRISIGFTEFGGPARVATPAAPNWDASAIASHAMLYLDSPPAFREAMFREAAASGATSIRVDVPIPAIVRGREGERSWEELDDVTGLARQYDLEVVGLIYGTPWWLARCPDRTEDLDYYECPPSSAPAFAKLAREIARRTRGTIDTWQILNEPNNRYVFAGSVRDYARVLIATSHAIRSVNP